MFRGHTTYTHTPYGDFYGYYGVPASWGFLMFCAAWTVLIVIFHLVAGISFADRALIGYIRVAVEAVAVLSWLAGFIAVAVEISTDTEKAHAGRSRRRQSSGRSNGCYSWLPHVMLVFNSPRKSRTSTTRPGAAV